VDEDRPMTTTTRYEVQRYKECAGMGCRNRAICQLEVRYIKKIGWFCDNCKGSLIADGLANEITDNHESEQASITPDHPQNI
jgi:hypothetical protein